MDENLIAWRAARAHAGEAGGVAVARRYSGDVAVTMIYRDQHNDYACRVVSPHGTRLIFVGSPAIFEHAVDCKTAFDDAARAAIAFAEDEGLACQPEYDAALTQVAVCGTRPRDQGEV